MYLGDELTEILEALEAGRDYFSVEPLQMQIGVTVLPHFPKDSTDRNRTSPFAFTGNKFEFRMLGSALSIAEPNIILNTVVAESLRQFADRLEQSTDWSRDLDSLIKETFSKHKRIIFNGNNYSDEWVQEAKKRGLSNLKTTMDALPELTSPKSIEVFRIHRIFTETELRSRYEILVEAYCKTIHIEALTMVEMVKTKIIPACIDYQMDLSSLLMQKKACGDYDVSLEDQMLTNIAGLSSNLMTKLTALETTLLGTKNEQDITARAGYYRDSVHAAIVETRLVVDELETLVSAKHWPFPTYAHLLYSVM